MPAARPSQRADALECAHWVAASFRISDRSGTYVWPGRASACFWKLARKGMHHRDTEITENTASKISSHDVVDDSDDDGADRAVFRVEDLTRAVALVEHEDALVGAGAD